MEVQSLIEKHNVQIRLLKQIEHFEILKNEALKTLDALPAAMRITANRYSQKVSKYTNIINRLKYSYKGYERQAA